MNNCHDNFLRNEYDKIIKERNSNDTFPWDEIRKKPTSVSPYLEEFDMLKKLNVSATTYVNEFSRLMRR